MPLEDRSGSAESSEPEEYPFRTGQAFRLIPRRSGGAYSNWVCHTTTLKVGYTLCNLHNGHSELRWRRHLPPRLQGSHPEAGGQQPRPTPTSVRIELKGASPVDALQTILGQALLVLTGLAVVLLATILVLAEAHLVLRLARKLTQSVSEDQGGR